jgi:hypothetical protein
MADFECIRLPTVDADLQIRFLGGGSLKGLLDFSQALPTDCTVSFNLLAQLSAGLGSVDCILKMFRVFSAFLDFLGPPPNLGAAGAVADAIKELEPCITAALPGVGMLFTIQDSIRIIVRFLNCLVGELNTLLEARAGIDLSIAVGNPKLQSILECAQANVDISAQAMLKSLAPIQLILQVLGSLPGAPPIPDISNLSAESDLTVVVNGLNGVIGVLEGLAV